MLARNDTQPVSDKAAPGLDRPRAAFYVPAGDGADLPCPVQLEFISWIGTHKKVDYRIIWKIDWEIEMKLPMAL